MDLAVPVSSAVPGGSLDDVTIARDSAATHLTAAQVADAKRQSAALQAKLNGP
jgi:hypothetical protein